MIEQHVDLGTEMDAVKLQRRRKIGGCSQDLTSKGKCKGDEEGGVRGRRKCLFRH